MSLICEVGSLQVPGTSGLQTINLNNFATEDPKAIILFGSFWNTTGVTTGALYSMGFATAASQVGIGMISPQASAASDSNGVDATDACVICLDAAKTINLKGVFDGFGANSFGIDWTLVNATYTNGYLNYVVIGGTDITNATITEQLSPNNDNGIHAYTGLGFSPDMVFCLSAARSSADTKGVGYENGRIGFGMFNSTVERALGAGSGWGSDPTDAFQFHSDHCIHAFPSTGGGARAFLQSMDADGYSLFWQDSNSVQRRVYFLNLEGGIWTILTGNTPTAAPTDQTLTGSGTLKGAIMFGSPDAASTVAVAGARPAYGAFDGSRQRCAGFAENDNTASGDTDRWHTEIETLRMYNNVPALKAACEASFNGEEMQLNWTTITSGSAYRYSALLIGEDATPAASSSELWAGVGF